MVRTADPATEVCGGGLRAVPIGKGKPHPLGFPFFRVRGDLALH